jgi:magnesium-dependent phosphatase 1
MSSLSSMVSPIILLTIWFSFVHSLAYGWIAPSAHHNRRGLSLLNASQSKQGKHHNKKKPKLVVFDLDGCLWSPEMYELLYYSGGRGSPFTPDEKDSRIMRTVGGEKVRLLGQVREVMYELQYEEHWWETQVGISSKTDEPNWARELLDKFIIGDEGQENPPFPLKQVFTPEICELARDSKVQHFERILRNAPGKPKYTDCLFFDNELGNCRQIAALGVTVCYCPKGVTRESWEEAIYNFPSSNGKIIGK